MFEQEPKVILIKDDEDDQCNKKITYLRSQRFCQMNAKLCQQRCAICEQHGQQILKQDHRIIRIEQFNKYFANLQLSCDQETEHYKRQLNEAQRNAIENIAKKKQEYLKEIDDIKVHMMKKTYRNLDEKYPRLYEKYRNMRYDTLTCCEVFWVINALPIHHNIKHSQVNKKLESVLKKFQNFKEISRNIGSNQNIFNNKARAKKGKLAQKIADLQPKFKSKEVGPELDNENFKSYREKEEQYKRQIIKLSQQLVSLKQKKLNYEKSVRILEHELNELNKKKLNKKRMSIHPKVISIKWIKTGKTENQREKIDVSIQKPSVGPLNNTNNMINAYLSQKNNSNVYSLEKSSSSDPSLNQSKQQSKQNQLQKSNNSGQPYNSLSYLENRISEVARNSSILLNSQPSAPVEKSNSQNPILKSSPVQQSKDLKQKPVQMAAIRPESSHHTQKARMVHTLESQLRGYPSFNANPLSSNKDDNKNNQSEIKKPEQNKGIDSRELAQQKSEQSNNDKRGAQIRYTNSFQIMPLSVSSVGPVSSQRSQANKDVEVKMEESKQPFKPWKNTQLLQQIRKSGKKSQNPLKVEDIIAMSQLAFIKPPSDYAIRHAQSIRSSNSVSSSKINTPGNSNQFKMLVDNLFNKEEKRRQNEDKGSNKKK